ncbi:MAG TPA: hypothetical protein VHP60_02710 [Thermoanaerobaculia bacterium]|nr:hypothetical protein [Thermoanaerobaculia bacterium]
MKKRFFILAAVLCALTVAALPGCSTNTQGDSASPVFLAGDFELLPLQKCVNDNTVLQFSTTVLRNRLKNPAASATQFLDVQIDTYIVVWRRIDGGTTASPSQSFGGNIIVPPNGQSTLTDYPYMTADNLLRPPLDQLFPFNGGIDRETGRAEIRESGSVTWSGHTLSGQPVVSNVATFDMIFLFCGSTGRIEAKRAQ